MAGHHLMFLLTAAAGLVVSNAASVSSSGNDIYPDIAQTSHASAEAIRFFHSFFTAKSSDNATALLKLYNANQTEYYDSTLGFTIASNRSQLVQGITATEQRFAESAPNDRSYPLRILGNISTGAIVYFEDTAGLFGGEVRTISSFDFLNGTIRRQLDNWDGRGNPAKTNSTGDAQYPDLGLPGLAEKAAPIMQTTANKLNNALSTGNATAAAALFNHDAIFEDLTLRVRVEGQVAIEPYLERVLAQGLPYGQGAKVTHVLGSAIGGGYEWRPSGNTVRYGITALELEGSGNITRFTAVWDGSRVSQAVIQGLAKQAPTP